MAIFKEILPSDVKTSRSSLNQLIDVLQEDMYNSSSRRKYQVFVTGGLGPGVTSSLYQTIYDQDFTLQTANPICDMTVGLLPGGSTALTSQTGVDSAGKETFPASSLMMREKLDIYRQFAQVLLGDSSESFKAPLDSTDSSNIIDAALFISIKRLFSRDQVKRDSFAMKFYPTASITDSLDNDYNPPLSSVNGVENLTTLSITDPYIFTDIGSSVNKLTTFGGQVGNIVNAANTAQSVGLLFYDRGIVVLDLKKITQSTQFMSGSIDAINSLGTITLGGTGTETVGVSKFIPDFLVSGSIDNIIDHIAGTRFGDQPQSAITFQNVTNINSTLIFCKLGADEFNYSSNPSFIDDDNRIVTIDQGQEDTQQTFTYLTSVGLYDANNNLLAVAKVSRPIEKSPERDLTLRIRLDF
jgi:hypothetical protein